MLDHFKIITVTHKRINLKEIGQFVVQEMPGMPFQERLVRLRDQFGFQELMYLATCNRVMYFFWTEQALNEQLASRFLLAANPQLSNDTLNRLSDYAYLLEGDAALTHLFEVASAIDSLVVGEHQILGQLREAYEQCQEWGLTGDNIRMAVQQAIVAAKSIYSNTHIGDKPVSIVSLAFQSILRAQLPKDARILLIGAGQTNQLVGKFLVKYEFSNIHVFNRTFDRADELAANVGGTPHLFSEAAHFSGGFDCLIVCTGAVHALITPELYEQLLQGESGRKIVIDLSIPHNVDPVISQRFNVQYIEIEGLRQLAKENLAYREQEVKQARQLLKQHLEQFPALFRQRQLELALREVPTEIKAVKSKVLNDVFRREVEALDESTRELIERMLGYMEKKCIGIPMRVARETLLK